MAKKKKAREKPAGTKVHYVYVIECADGTLYTGYTTDVQRRVEEHNSGQGAKYTRGRTPVRLVYTEEFNDRGDAMGREAEIKKMSRDEKEKLVEVKELGVGDE